MFQLIKEEILVKILLLQTNPIPGMSDETIENVSNHWELEGYAPLYPPDNT